MSFWEYYEYYLSLHQNKWCRRLHLLGQLMTIIFVFSVIYFAITINLLIAFLLIFSPFIVYPLAWTGHFVFEKNTPAAFKNPIWAKMCDWIMLWNILKGNIPF